MAGSSYSESANISKVMSGLLGGNLNFQNAQTSPKLSFKDGYSREVKQGQTRNDIKRLPIRDSYKSR